MSYNDYCETNTCFAVSPAGSLSGNPYTDAGAYASNVSNFVTQQIDEARSRYQAQLASMDVFIQDLADFPLLEIPEVPGTPVLDPEPKWNFGKLPAVNPEDFGVIQDPNIGDPPPIGALPTIDDVNISPFKSSISGITVPPPPSWQLVPKPGGPPAANITLPSAPIIAFPDEPPLTDVNIPQFNAPVIPPFDAEYPEFNDSAINTVVNWEEPTYVERVIDDSIAQIITYFNGGTGIKPEVEEAIVNRGKDREDRIIKQNVNQATDEWSNRGYTAPPGQMLERVDQIREEGAIKKLALNREVVIRAMDIEVENIRFAVQQGLAAEQILIDLFQAEANRAFEIAKLNVQLALEYYNLRIAAYNAKMKEVEVRARVYELYIQQLLADIEVFKAQIQGELGKAEINKAKVETFRAQIQARELIVGVYESQVRAAGVSADVYRAEVEGYKGEVEAYAASVQAQRARFDAYESQVRGEAAKAGIIEAEARAYQAEIGGISAGVDAQRSALDGAVNAYRAKITGYAAEVDKERAVLDAQARRLEGNVRGYEADLNRLRAAYGLEEAKARISVAAWEAENSQMIQHFSAEVARFQAVLQGLVSQSQLALDASKAAGQLSSTVAAGALAGMSVTATVQGQGSISASGSNNSDFRQSFSKACNTSNSVSFNVTSEGDPGKDCSF